MTSTYSTLGGLPGFGGGAAPAPLQGLPGFAPPPQAVSQPGGPVGLPAALQGTSAAQFDAARPVQDIGMGATIATQAGRGLLDAALGSGAVLGAASESVGNLTGWRGLEDFGRDLGRSSSGAAAMEAASFLFGKSTGGNQRGLTYADKAANAIAEQEKAWPMLTTVSRIGGGVGLALATGGLSGASGGVANTLGGMVGIGAYEGASGGMQAAYAANESLRDVLISGVTGAAFGAGSGGVLHYGAGKVAGFFDNRSTLRQVFGDIKTAADDVATAVKDAGGREMYDAAKAILKERAEVIAKVAAAGENPSMIRQAYDKASRAAGEKLSQLAGDFDAASWSKTTPSPLQKLLHRTPLLDQISADLAENAGKLKVARPTIDFELRVPSKLLADADKTAAISGLQARVTQLIEQAPDSGLRNALMPISDRLSSANARESMALGHQLVNRLATVARETTDDVTRSYAQRQARAIADELGGDAWGGAGRAYRAMTRADSAIDNLDQKTIREALRHADSSRAMPGAFAENTAELTAAYAARRELGGEYADAATRKLMGDASELADKAHTAVTFDGAPARRVLDILSGAGKNIGESYASDLLGAGVGFAIGGVPGMLVSRALAPVLGDIAAAAFGKVVTRTGEKAGRGFAREVVKQSRAAIGDTLRGSLTWQQYDYQASINQLVEAVTGTPQQRDELLKSMTPKKPPGAPHYLIEKAKELIPPDFATDVQSIVQPGQQQQQQQTSSITQRRDAALAALPPEVQAQAGADMQQKLSQLMSDIPKPVPNVRGKAWETLSSSDLRKSQAMWEATMQPMSVFEDFQRGNVDYDKVRYAWKQYPGLKTAAQAGLIDIIHAQLGEEERASISDGMLTQLDNLFGFDGTLQPTLDAGFAQRMSALAAPEQNRPKPQGNGVLKMPGSEPTFTQRIAGAKTA